MHLLRALPLLVVWCAAVGALAADGAKTKDLIVGRWKTEGTFKEKENGKDVLHKVTVVLEFTKDGKLKTDEKADNGEHNKVEGTYKVLDEKTLETTIAEPGKTKTTTHKITIDTLTKTKLILVDEKTPKTEFERIK